MEQTHSTAIYKCPCCPCGQTFTGAELTETTTPSGRSLVRSTPCHGSTPLLVTPSLNQRPLRLGRSA
jgi:hypothetical protein